VLMVTTHLFGVLQIQSSLPTTGVVTDMTTGPSSSSFGEQSLHPRRPTPGLSYGCRLTMHVMLPVVYVALASPVLSLNSKGDVWVSGVIPR
jgi:hypothetical protein